MLQKKLLGGGMFCQCPLMGISIGQKPITIPVQFSSRGIGVI